MLLLEAGNIKKYYADRMIIGFEELTIYTGDRIGVVGINGSGKTTLLEMLYGRLEPDEGYVKRYCEMGYIRQFDEASEMKKHRKENETDNYYDRKLLKMFNVDQKLQREGLSGGERTRLKIAGALGKDNVLLFADEPTSNLDFKGIELLRKKLERIESFLLISHDRSLLDSLCNRILEVKDGRIRIFSGNYTFYRQQCEMELEREALEYEKYIETKTALEDAIADRKKRAKKIKKAPSRMGNSEARLHTRSANEKQEKIHNAANSLITRLEKLEVKEKPREQPGIRLDFSLTNPPENKIVISAGKLSFSYGDVPVFREAGLDVHNRVKTAVWGENGTGKTTLLNLIYEAYSGAKSGSGSNGRKIDIAPKARLGYFRQSFENLVPEESILRNVMRDSVQTETVVRTILARLLLQADAVYKKVSVLSGGEKIKVAFAKLFVSNANVLLLDEPTNYLDMKSIEALEGVLKEYEGTVLFVSHDRAFVKAIADRLLILENMTIRSYDGGLEEYEAAAAACEKPVDDIQRTLLQMKLTQVITKLSGLPVESSEKEALEQEYRLLVEQLRD